MRTFLKRSGLALLAAVGLAGAETAPRFADIQKFSYGSDGNYKVLRTDAKTAWVVRASGLLRLREGVRTWMNVANSPLLSDLSSSTLAAVDSSRNLWIAGPVGIQRIDTAGEWTTWRFSEGLLPQGSNRSLSIDGNKVYVLRDSARALRFVAGKWDTLDLQVPSTHPVTQLAVVKDTLWTASTDTAKGNAIQILAPNGAEWIKRILPAAARTNNVHEFLVMGDTVLVASYFSGKNNSNPGDDLAMWRPGVKGFTTLIDDGSAGFTRSIERISGGFLITRNRYLLSYPGTGATFDTLSNYTGNPFPNSGYRLKSFVSDDGTLVGISGKKPAVKGLAIVQVGILYQVTTSGAWIRLEDLGNKDHVESSALGKLQFRPDGTGMLGGFKGIYSIAAGGDSLKRWDAGTWSGARPVHYDFVSDSVAVALAGKDSVVLLRKGTPTLLSNIHTKDSISVGIAGLPQNNAASILFTNLQKDLVTYDGVWSKSLLVPKGYYRQVEHAPYGNSIWVRSDSAVYRWTADGQMVGPASIPLANSLSPVDDSTAWVAAPGGLWKATLSGGSLSATLVHATSRTPYAVRALSRDRVWAVLATDTLVRFGASDSAVYTSANFPIPAGGVYEIAQDSADGLWLRGMYDYQGLVRIDLAKWFPPVQVGIGSARSGAQGLTASLRRDAVAFTTTAAGAARLEVMDASGRVLAVRELGTLAAGSHEVPLPEGKGLRLVRMITAQGSRTFRIAGF